MNNELKMVAIYNKQMMLPFSLKGTRKNQKTNGRDKKKTSTLKMVYKFSLSRRFPVHSAHISRRYPVLRATGYLREMFRKCVRHG